MTRLAAMRAVAVSVALALSAQAGSASGAAATVSGADLARCAAITAPDARLACYDALSRRQPPASSAADTTPASPPAAAPPPGARAAPAPGTVEAFGYSAAQLNAPLPQGPAQITAHVQSSTDTRAGDTVLVLDNGQTWQFNDPTALLKAGDTVTIKRASLGSYLLLTPTKQTLRVRRTN